MFESDITTLTRLNIQKDVFIMDVQTSNKCWRVSTLHFKIYTCFKFKYLQVGWGVHVNFREPYQLIFYTNIHVGSIIYFLSWHLPLLFFVVLFFYQRKTVDKMLYLENMSTLSIFKSFLKSKLFLILEESLFIQCNIRLPKYKQ